MRQIFIEQGILEQRRPVPCHERIAFAEGRPDFTPFLGLGFGVVHRSNMYAALDNTVVLPGFTRMDAALFVRLTRVLRVQANIGNIGDVNYIASADNNNNISPGAGCIYRLTAVANF